VARAKGAPLGRHLANGTEQAPGQRADPVTNGHRWEHAPLEVLGRVGHSMTEARGAKTSAVAAQRDELCVATFSADQMQSAPILRGQAYPRRAHGSRRVQRGPHPPILAKHMPCVHR
jgi:hypothetical protein